MLKILEFPDPRLRKKSKEVACFDADLKALCVKMEEAMREAGGVGLAAIQIGEPIRLLLMDCDGSPEGAGKAMAICNPRILSSEGVSELAEGCLSVPGIQETIGRAARVSARWQDAEGAQREGVFEGLAAVCLQHEMDHLDGRIFFERLPGLRASRARERYFKLKKNPKGA